MGGKVERYNPYAEYLSQYMTVEMLASGTISLTIGRTSSDRTVGYSINDGSWVDTSYRNADNSPKTITTPSLNTGDKVRWRCESVDGAFSKSYGVTSYFASTANCNVYGNALSLVYGDSFEGEDSVDSSFQTFRESFKNGFKCVNAEYFVFPIDTVHGNMFFDAFYRNAILEKGPALLSSEIQSQALRGMFSGCTSLQSIAILADTVNTSQNDWAKSVPSGGVLTKKKGTTWNLLPSGWTINYISI